jgi:3-oxoadipate enol-lactonase
MANGVSLYYELTGSGERLLSISGTGGDLRNTPKLSEGPFAEAFEILAYDQRGLGQSSVPRAPYGVADFADDATALLDAVGWEDCAVLGVSFGGMVAQELAIRHPERVRRLALACTSAGGRGGASFPLQDLFALEPEERTARQMELLDTRWDAEWRAAHPEQVQLIADRLLRAQGEAPGGGPSEGLANQLEARAKHDTTDRLGAITCPTFVCGGHYDGIAPPANSEFLARTISGARLAFYEGGHLFLIQDAAAIPDVIAFLRGEERGALP